MKDFYQPALDNPWHIHPLIHSDPGYSDCSVNTKNEQGHKTCPGDGIWPSPITTQMRRRVQSPSTSLNVIISSWSMA